MPKIKSEDIAEALLDSRVVDALAKALAPFIALAIDESLNKKLDGLTATVRELKTENTRLAKQCEGVAKENEDLKKLVNDHGQRLDAVESYSRRDNLIIRGLPEMSSAERATGGATLDDHSSRAEVHTSVETTVIDFCQRSLGIALSPRDIAIAHRLKAGTRDKCRPVIVRFANFHLRNQVYNSRKQLKDSTEKVFISEHLTKSSSDLFFEARRLLREKKIFGAWTRNGEVFVRFSPDHTTRGILVKTRADLKLQ
jgi:hypothetical protein